MYVEYDMACATSASGAHNLGGGVRKSGVRISPLLGAGDLGRRGRALGCRGRSRGHDLGLDLGRRGRCLSHALSLRGRQPLSPQL